jgi:hypothetical protein
MPQPPKTTATDSKAALDALDTPALRERWCRQFGTDQAPRLKRQLLIGALAHAQQLKAHGGLKARARRTLSEIACQSERQLNNAPVVTPGTRLVREWQGQSHTVETAANGYLWQGRQFTSLSAVAREITGTRWSGPRFFGLNASKAGKSK